MVNSLISCRTSTPRFPNVFAFAFAASIVSWLTLPVTRIVFNSFTVAFKSKACLFIMFSCLVTSALNLVAITLVPSTSNDFGGFSINASM